MAERFIDRAELIKNGRKSIILDMDTSKAGITGREAFLLYAGAFYATHTSSDPVQQTEFREVSERIKEMADYRSGFKKLAQVVDKYIRRVS